MVQKKTLFLCFKRHSSFVDKDHVKYVFSILHLLCVAGCNIRFVCSYRRRVQLLEIFGKFHL